jgi:PAS domain S-box-containing protein
MLRAVAAGCEQLLGAPDWRSALPAMFQQIAAAARLGRLFLFENRIAAGGAPIHVLRAEAAAGVPPLRGHASLESFSPCAAGLSRWADACLRGDIVHGALTRFPVAERPFLAALGARSIASAPVFAGPDWWGFLGAVDGVRPRRWSPSELDALRLLARAIGSSVERHRLRSAGEQQRGLFESLGEGAALIDERGHFVFGNARAAAALGVSGDRLAGRHLRDFLSDRALRVRWTRVRRSRSAARHTYEVSATRADGAKRLLRVTLSPDLRPDGGFGGVFAVFRDITERKRDEKQLRLLAHALESTAEAVTITDAGNNLL